MSYILDALKKADAERERGHIPGMHTQASPATRLPARAMRPAAVWLMAASVAAVLAGGWWWRSFSEDRPALAATRPADSSPPAMTTIRPLPPSSVSPESVLPRPFGGADATAASPKPLESEKIAATPSAAPTTSPVRSAGANRPSAQMAPAQITAAPAPSAASAKRSEAAQEAPATASVQPAARPARQPAAAKASAAPDAGPRVASITELPPSVRQSLPKLVISGATYSDNPAWRMVIINGQVYREGEKPSADLQLEQIRPKTAVLNYKGQRFSVGY